MINSSLKLFFQQYYGKFCLWFVKDSKLGKYSKYYILNFCRQQELLWNKPKKREWEVLQLWQIANFLSMVRCQYQHYYHVTAQFDRYRIQFTHFFRNNKLDSQMEEKWLDIIGQHESQKWGGLEIVRFRDAGHWRQICKDISIYSLFS